MRKIGVGECLGEGLILPGRWARGGVALGGCDVASHACCGCSTRVNRFQLASKVCVSMGQPSSRFEVDVPTAGGRSKAGTLVAG